MMDNEYIFENRPYGDWAIKVTFFSYGKKIRIPIISFSCGALDSPFRVDKHL